MRTSVLFDIGSGAYLRCREEVGPERLRSRLGLLEARRGLLEARGRR